MNETGKVSKISKIMRFTAFVVCFCVVFMAANSLFSIPPTHMTHRFITFYSMPENSLDAVYIGSSAVDRYYIPTMGWEQEGITVYPLSSNVQPIVAARYLVEEALKTQSPSVFIIETRGCKKETSTDTEGVYRSLTDQMKFSWTRIKLINALLDFNDFSVWERPAYYFSLTTYHNTWEDGFDEEDFVPVESAYMGYYVSNKSTNLITPFEKPVYTAERAPLEDGVEEALLDLIEYAREENVKLLFVSSPFVTDELEMKRINTISDILEREGMTYLNFNSPASPLYDVIDYSHDFYNEGHVNVYGAEKYTEYLAGYLRENYSLADRRELNDGIDYSKWDESAETVNTKLKALKKKTKTE